MKWYLSFVEDRAFKGACVVEAESLEHALRVAWKRKCNPGGHVMGIPVPKEKDLGWPLYKLMSRAELEVYGPTVRRGDMPDPPQTIGNN